MVLLFATAPEWESDEQGDECWVLESGWQGSQNLLRRKVDWNEKDIGFLSGLYSQLQNYRLGHARVPRDPQGARWHHQPRSGWLSISSISSIFSDHLC